MNDEPAGPISDEVALEIVELSAAAATRLGVASDADPPAIVSLIKDHVERVRPLKRSTLEEQSLEFSCLWAEQLRRSLGWEWLQTLTPQGEEDYLLVSPDRALALRPASYFHALLGSRRSDNTVLLLYNMLNAGNVPVALPGELYMIG